MKNENTIFYILGAIILVALLISSQVPKETGMISLTPHYYKEGVEVIPEQRLFSIVTPPGGSYDQILFDVNGVATGDIPFSNIQVVDAYPIVFKNSLPTNFQSSNPGQSKKLWGEGDYVAMDTVQFEGQTINFWVEVSAVNDYTGEIIYAPRAYSGDITFEPEILEWGYETSYPIVLSSTDGIFWDGVKWTVAGVGMVNFVPGFIVEEYDFSWNYIQSYKPGKVGCVSGMHKKDGQWFNYDICDGYVYEFNNDWSYVTNYYIGDIGGWIEGIFWVAPYWYGVSDYSNAIVQFNSDWVYTGQNWNIGSEDSLPKDIYWDGANWWMLGASTKTVYKYDSSWSYTGESYPIEFGFGGMFKKDNKWFTVGNKEVYKYFAGTL